MFEIPIFPDPFQTMSELFVHWLYLFKHKQTTITSAYFISNTYYSAYWWHAPWTFPWCWKRIEGNMNIKLQTVQKLANCSRKCKKKCLSELYRSLQRYIGINLVWILNLCVLWGPFSSFRNRSFILSSVTFNICKICSIENGILENANAYARNFDISFVN